jgi:hypothetical protein
MNTTTAEATKDILLGYGKHHQAALSSLLNVQDWQRIAQQELERRTTNIVQALDIATLEAIASGEMDMRAVCQQALDEIRQG